MFMNLVYSPCLQRNIKLQPKWVTRELRAQETRQAINWLWNGEIGEVTRVDSFTNRPIWPQGIPTPKEKDPIPDTLDWDSFIGPAKYRDYNSIYTPWNFRGWWDFGSGALGDMANHILQVASKGLNLGYPDEVIGSSTMLMTDSCPSAEKITYHFPARDNMKKMACPPVVLNWYDGGITPELPFDMPADKHFDENGVTVYYGTKDTMVVGTYGYNPFLVSGRNPKVSRATAYRKKRQSPARLDSCLQGKPRKPRSFSFGFQRVRTVERNGSNGMRSRPFARIASVA